MPEQTQAILWRGGLNTSLDKALIAPNELADGQNFIVRDGTCRLDRRYILKGDPGATSPQGSGWGKYGTSGTLTQQYVTVNGTKLYEYDLTQLIPTWAEAATGMTAGNWFWQQFANYLYGIHGTAGMGRKLLGAGTNGHGDWGLIQPPAAPTAAPTAPQNASYQNHSSWVGSTHAETAGTVTYVTNGDFYRCNFTSTQAGPQTVTITYRTSATDLRPDWQYHDIISTSVVGSWYPSDLRIGVFTTAGGSTSTDAVPWFRQGQVGVPGVTLDRIANISRSGRAQVTKVSFTFNVPTNGGYVNISSPHAFGVWLSLGLTTNVSLNTNPTFKPLQYEYTYYNAATGLESPPSPQLSIPATQQWYLGDWRDVTCASTGAGGVSHIRVYRRIETGGTITRYRLAELSNSGTQVHTDKLAADEVTGLTAFTPSIFPSGTLTAITAWLNRLVIAAGNTVYISRDSDPLSFVDSTVIYDPSDSARAFTTPVDDRNAEIVQGLVGEDSLYIVTDFSTRCLFGTTPDNWRLVKISDSEGAVGPRSWCSYKGGVLVLTPSGRLMFYSLGNDPDEVSEKLKARIGNQGMKALAVSTSVVSVTPEGEIEVRAATGAYYVMDVEGNWRSGTHTHPTHSTLFISGLAPRWIGTDGKLYEGGDDSYVSDGGVTGTSGTPVTGYITTRDERMQRSSCTNVFLDAVQTIDPDDTTKTIFPRLTPICKRTTAEGLVNYKARWNEKNLRVGINVVGEEMQWKIEFDKNSVITEMRVTYDRQGDARHK